MSCAAVIKPAAAPFIAPAKDVPPPSLCSHLTSPVSSAPDSSISKIPSLSSSISMSSATPSPSVSSLRASLKSTSFIGNCDKDKSPSESLSAAAPVVNPSFTTKPSSAVVPFCESKTSNKPSPSLSVLASEASDLIGDPVSWASIVSLMPSPSESVSI